ncbi:MAG: hypothetical protein WC346_05480 [Methanogenium sp.]|jgi:hypothetical protein
MNNVFNVVETKKQEYWNHFLTLKNYWPHGFTLKRLEKVKPFVWLDDDFWADIIHYHNGENRSPDQMLIEDRYIYQHCFGNFAGWLLQIMAEKGILK